MHVEVIAADESSNQQARTYAEYRVFATLTRHSQYVRSAQIILQRGEHEGTCDTIVCIVTVALQPSGDVRIRARGRHAYAAINRAVERTSDLMRRRAGLRLSS